MRAGVPLAVVDLPDERPSASGWLRVAVAVAGICGSDWPLFSRPPDDDRGSHGVLGHEVAGVVVAATGGDDTNAWIGRRVTFDPMIGCGACDACRAGRKNVCERGVRTIGRDVPGGFAEAVWIPATQALELPAGVTFRQAAFAEPLAVVMRAFRRVAVDADTRLAVVGDGTLALLALAVARESGIGARTLIYKHPARAALAQERHLASRSIACVEPLPETEWNAYDVVIEAAGGEQSATIRSAVDVVRPGGTVLVLGAFGRAFTTGFPYAKTFRKEVALIGVHSYGRSPGEPDSEFRAALEVLARGTLPIEALVERYVSLDEAPAYLTSIVAGARKLRPKVALEFTRGPA